MSPIVNTSVDSLTFGSQRAFNIKGTSIVQQQQLELIASRFPNTLFYSVNGTCVIKTTPSSLVQLLTFLKSHTLCDYSQLIDITAIDNSECKLRFEVVYFLLSISQGNRLTVSVSVAEGISIPSVTEIYSSAGWLERETWDRFGIFFSSNKDLRRRLTDYGFKGHPLRKDFPLTGFVEVRYDDFSKRIVYTNVSLAQEYRIFTLDNPWKN